MKMSGLQGNIMRLSGLKDKLIDNPEVAFRLAQLKRFERLRDEHGLTAAEAADIVGISRATLYRWRQRLSRGGLKELASASRRPRTFRKRRWTMKDAEAVWRLRMRFPAWGKSKLGPLLRAQGHQRSDSTVGRILSWLKQRGRLPVGCAYAKGRRHGRSWRRLWAKRAPYGLKAERPGDLVQVDVLHVRLLPGVTVYHFTAWDSASRWRVGQGYSRVTSRCAADFLNRLKTRCPFPIRAIQIDGGSEFKGEFEQACQEANIALYALPPKRPQRNGGVERWGP